MVVNALVYQLHMKRKKLNFLRKRFTESFKQFISITLQDSLSAQIFRYKLLFIKIVRQSSCHGLNLMPNCHITHIRKHLLYDTIVFSVGMDR